MLLMVAGSLRKLQNIPELLNQCYYWTLGEIASLRGGLFAFEPRLRLFEINYNFRFELDTNMLTSRSQHPVMPL